MRIAINGDDISAIQLNKDVPVDNTVKSQIKARYTMFPELDYTKPGYVLALDPMTQIVNGELAYLVTVTRPDGLKVKNYFDTKTGLKVKQVTDVQGASVNEFSDYRAINGGIKIPYTFVTGLLGESVEFKITDAVANSDLSAGEFK